MQSWKIGAMPYCLPEYFIEHYPVKPLLNSEPML